MSILTMIKLGALGAILIFLWTGTGLPQTQSEQFDARKAGFTVHYRDLEIPYRLMSVFVNPGESLSVRIAPAHRRGTYRGLASHGVVTPQGDYEWKWTAPQRAGRHRLTVLREGDADSITFNLFVMVPYSQLKKESLNGYRIGRYPEKPYRNLEVYLPPKGFVEISPGMDTVQVSPHFTLGQFFCKQSGGYPRYLVLRTALLLKLEVLLEEMNRRGYHCPTFEVLSGYRTPYYNKAIGNVPYSRHQWGGAADIFIDVNPKDGVMDDLNKDGKINAKDAAVMYRIIDELYGKAHYQPYIGGLGRYRATENHGPFVHVDVRGFRARWTD